MKVQINNFNDELVEVELFQLLQWKHAVHLEMLGMKHSRGSVTAHVRRILGAPPRYPRDKIYQHLSGSLKDLQRRPA